VKAKKNTGRSASDPRQPTAVIDGPARQRPDLLPYLYASLLILLFAFVYTAILDSKVEVVGDNAAYYILGKALYEGAGYTFINVPEAPPATLWPPGYPALIALTMTLWSSDFVAVKSANGIVFMLALVAAFFLFRRLSGNVHLAFVAAVAMLCNGHLLRSSTLIMSETLFLLCAVLVLLVGAYIAEAEEDFRRPQIYLLVLCLIAAFYVRTVGIFLFGSVCLILVWQRQWKYLALTTVGYILATLPWHLRGRNIDGGSAYISAWMRVNPYQPELGTIGLQDLLLRLFNNAERYISIEIPDGLFYYIVNNDLSVRQATTTSVLSGIILVLLAGYGFYAFKRSRLLVVAYVGAVGGVLLIWPEVWSGTRFLQPLIPLLLLGIFNGLWVLARVLLRRWVAVRYVHSLLLAPLLFIYYEDVEYLNELAKRGVYPQSWLNYFEVARWVDENTPADTIVACRKPNMFYLYANRRTVSYAFTPDAAELIADLERKQVDYVVAENLGFSSTRRYLLPAIEQEAERFSVVYKREDPDAWLFKFMPAD
jgi:hypothetical protein